MLMHGSVPLLVMDYVDALVGAVVFVLVMSLVKEPTRRNLNAIIVAGASSVYLSGGFGPWELVYPAIVTPVVYRGLRSHRFIGLAWLMHSCWDIVHHLWGNPIWPFMPTSSFGCMIFDALSAVWFLAGAPSIFAFLCEKTLRFTARRWCDRVTRLQPTSRTANLPTKLLGA